MRITPTAIPDVLLIEPGLNRDERGTLFEIWNAGALAEAGFDQSFVQDNLTWSAGRGVVRALHFQAPPADQGKLVACVSGAIYDVAVDIRAGSPSFGRHVAVELREDGRQLWIPSGFAHGYCTLEPDTRVLYKLTTRYAPEAMGGLLWSDPALGIDWPVSAAEAVVNERDRAWPGIGDLVPPFRLQP